jgi:carboxyl-terminal processing protease
VPDSLVTEYSTRNGRKVYDGGGITPDVKIASEEFARITQELVLQDFTFDFINNYALKHPEIASISEFKLTDEIYQQFKEYLKEKKFSYETQSQKILEKLIEATKNEKYYSTTKDKIEELQKSFSHSIDRDMELFKEEIATLLAEQFIQRYYFFEGVIEYNINYDKETKEAINILANQEKYQEILKGTEKKNN